MFEPWLNDTNEIDQPLDLDSRLQDIFFPPSFVIIQSLGKDTIEMTQSIEFLLLVTNVLALYSS